MIWRVEQLLADRSMTLHTCIRLRHGPMLDLMMVLVLFFPVPSVRELDTALLIHLC